MHEYWRRWPPVDWLAAGYLGYRSNGAALNRDADADDLVRLLGGAPGFSAA